MAHLVRVPQALQSLVDRVAKQIARLLTQSQQPLLSNESSLANRQYMRIRDARLSSELLSLMRRAYAPEGPNLDAAAELFATSAIYPMAHSLGRKEARELLSLLELEAVAECLLAEALLFSQVRRVELTLDPSSVIRSDQDFCLIYQYPLVPARSASQISGPRRQAELAALCCLDAAYSAGWATQALGFVVQARAMLLSYQGFEQCLYIIASPEHLDERAKALIQRQPQTAAVQILNRDWHAASGLGTEPDSSATVDEVGGLRSEIEQLHKGLEFCRQAEQALRAKEQRWRALVDEAFEAVLVSQNDQVIESNASAEQMFGYRSEQLLDIHLQDLFLPNEWGRLKRLIYDKHALQHETVVVRADGSIVHVELHHKYYREANQQVLVTAIRDVSERKLSEEKLRRLANFDALTDLPNRKWFFERVEQTIRQSRNDNKIHALLFVDLDDFKRVNDSLGHNVGDRLLRMVGACLIANSRADHAVARLGGDEFAVWIEDIKSMPAATKTATNITQALSKPFHLEGQDIVVTPSIGVALYPIDGRKVTDLLRNADTAMYHGKQLGGNRFQFFKPDMNEKARNRLQLEARLRQAVEESNLSIVFQPKVSLRTGRLTGLEALARWNDPTLGDVTPTDFIALAEDTGLIIKLGTLIFSRACEAARELNQAGIEFGKIAINISPRQFAELNLLDSIDEILNDYHVAPHWIEIEITESTLMDNPRLAIDIMESLKKRGVKITIDDFGTGFSSLSYLKDFPVDALKIDRTFIKDLHTQNSDVSLPSAIVALAHNLNLTVVAEGVERIEQLHILQDIRCDEIQGFIYSEALGLDELKQFLTASPGIQPLFANRQ